MTLVIRLYAMTYSMRHFGVCVSLWVGGLRRHVVSWYKCRMARNETLSRFDSLDDWTAGRTMLTLVVDRMDGTGEHRHCVSVMDARGYDFASDHAADIDEIGDGSAWYEYEGTMI